jgi:hypothetical protein
MCVTQCARNEAGDATESTELSDDNAAHSAANLGTIEIPAIGVTKSMFEGVTLRVLDNGPGHWPGSAMPGQTGNVVVAGHRVNRKDSGVKRYSSKAANAIRSRLLRDATPDTGCGLKAFERTLFMRLPRFNHMHRFLPALVRREGGLALSVAVNHRPRLHGQSKYGIGNRLWVGIVDIFGVMWLQRRRFRTGMATETRAEGAQQ